MKHSINRIINNPNDYKVCEECGSINWYENDECINCNNDTFEIKEDFEYLYDLFTDLTFCLYV